MKVVVTNDEYTIYRRRDGRYAVEGADKRPINGDEKITILLANELISVAPPAAPKEEPAPEEAEAAETEAEAAEAGDAEPAAEDAPEEAAQAPADEPSEEPAEASDDDAEVAAKE
jgi:hypothetical protein